MEIKKLKFGIGDKIRVRKDLKVGADYYNEKSKVFDTFTLRMKDKRGKEGKIVGFRGGKYEVDFDRFHTYTDDMLELVMHNFDEEETVANEPYTENQDVEVLVKMMSEKIPQQLIDDALDRGDKEAFLRLTEFYSNKNKNS